MLNKVDRPTRRVTEVENEVFGKGAAFPPPFHRLRGWRHTAPCPTIPRRDAAGSDDSQKCPQLSWTMLTSHLDSPLTLSLRIAAPTASVANDTTPFCRAFLLRPWL